MIAGRYTLEREVGRGGMGAVWLGHDDVLGREVALKRIGMAPGGSTPDLARAEREARLAARLNHPHVVAVYDLVTDGDAQWLVMEYVEGTTLTALVQREGRLSPDRAAPLLQQVADALAAAHTAGIVHRDVKPSNILVAADGQVKLSDFGIARAEADASLTQTGLVTGSPAYLSPEVASGQQATPASDVWSLGATLYYTLAGHPPYDVGDNVLGALYRIVHEDPPRLADSGRLGPLLEATMTVAPAQRWPMARVRDFLAGDQPVERTQVLTAPVPPPPPPPPATPAPAPAPAPAPTPAPAPRRRSHGGPLAIAVVIAAIVVLAVVAWIAGSTGGEPDRGATGTPASPKPSTQPSSPTTSSSTPQDVTADGMENFIEDYLATVTSDPRSAWPMLTPQFQAESGGFGSYQKFWRQFQGADVLSARADPQSKQISYTVEYLHTDGTKTRDDVTLTLDGTDDHYLISGES
ncbi:MAG TPA: serine/threonine-protein kinase [Nocardioides sp.]|nr:serine/threonine-protein kinase [Nocardioides sp.]